MKDPQVPMMRFELPEHAPYVRTLGYALGLNSGMLSPAFGGQMPPQAPVQAKGPVSTNDPEQFGKLFKEGHELGFEFGKQASSELANALTALPENCWWMVCLFFAGGLMQVETEVIPSGVPSEMKGDVERGVKAFRRIYRRHRR